MAVAAFVVRAGVLLVGLGVDQRRVEVDDQIITGRASARGPGPRACCGSCGGDAAKFDRADLVEGAPHRCLRRDLTEHRPLGAHRGQVRQTRRAVGKRQDHLRERATRIVAALGHGRHCCAQPGGQTREVGGLREPGDPGVRDQSLTIAGHRARPNQTATLNHENALRTSECDCCVATPIIPGRRAFSYDHQPPLRKIRANGQLVALLELRRPSLGAHDD